ncbi:hypothetical protein SEA_SCOOBYDOOBYDOO_65 [Mycobacterium phage ScoobyDoobyDoo]|nr:hypothetical protein SEA_SCOOBYDOOBYDOO_65 [Mycobacterium phage ScoobyDoobyDoo]
MRKLSTRRIALLGASAALGAALAASIVSAPEAGASTRSYLAELERVGILAYTGQDSCYDYPGGDGCSLRFGTPDTALRIGDFVCRDLADGESVSGVVYKLAFGSDGLTLNPENSTRVVMTANVHLCRKVYL